jgi:DNA-binding transcriptional regulator YdaS (Cro superfamily)
MDIEIIKAAIEGAGGPTKVARELNCSTQAVYFWQTGKRTLPAEHCPALERLNDGRIRCEQMRPDVDWAYLRGTQAGSDPTQAPAPSPDAAAT